MVNLSLDQWRGVYCHSIDTPSPSEDDVLAAIRTLDGKIHTLVFLEREEGYNLSIGGGPDLYICCIEEFGEFLTLTDAGAGDKTIMLVTGGQVGHFQERNCMPRELVERAALEYLRTGKRLRNVVWDRS